ncbi:hypothetical protein [Sorangium sp. So ce1335]|uniref:hypothetical protein n=1 Tax=Sorangium sp. So ce1335 TaxID=3133335 RepID=UPI003F61B523
MEANLRPIPPPHDEDDEDVHWALSTATALWARGEREEALRWLRRAAEQASDANADLRALELFKAAAEVAQKIDAPPAAAAEAPPTAGSVPPKAPLSAPPQAPGAPPAGASAPPPRPGASGPAAQPSRPPGPAGADAGRVERGGAGASSPSAVKRAPLVGAPASGAARPAPAAPERTPMPVKSAAGRAMTPTQLSPSGRTPGPPPALPARPTAATAGGPAGGTASTAAPKGRAIAGFSSAQTRVSSTTAVTEEVPVVKLPAASVRTGRGAGVALKGTSDEQHATEVDPPADQRETVPTNIAVGPGGRLVGSPVVGAASSQEATERRPRLWPEGDDEGTTRRPLTPQEQRVLMEHRIEDLDEETPMLGLEQMAGDGEGSAAAPPELRAEPNGSDERGGWTEAEPDDDDGGAAEDPQGESTLATGELAGATPAKGADAKAAACARAAADDRGTAAVDASWSDAPYEGEWQAPPPRLPASQIEPLPALRVAVIGISSTGELRLVPMDGRNAPPRGAALGILVPLSPGDGETIARLLQLRG